MRLVTSSVAVALVSCLVAPAFGQTPAPLNVGPSPAPTAPEGAPGGGGQQFIFNSVTAFGCDSGATAFNVTVTGFAAAPAYVDTIVSSGGEIYMDQLVQVTVDTSGFWVFYNWNDRGLQTQAYPIPAGQPVTHTNLVRLTPTGAPVWKSVVVLDGCDTGNVVSTVEGPLGPIQAIPTVSPAGLAALALTLGALAFWALRRRSAIPNR